MSPIARLAMPWLLAATAAVSPPPGAWPASAPEARDEGLGGTLIVTDDPDWEKEWNTPREYAPRFRTTTRVAPGGRLHILSVFHGAEAGPDGHADIRCDFRLVRPGGDVTLDERDVPCFAHALPDETGTLFLVDQTLVFVADESEPVGEYEITVVLHDAIAGTDLALSARFRKEAE